LRQFWAWNHRRTLGVKIHLSTIKKAFLCFNIYIPSKYIIVPSKNLTYFWHILQYHYYTLIYFHIHWNWPKTSLFCTSLSCHYKIAMAPHYTTKLSCICHDIFTRIQKWSIFHESHKSYWLIKCLNSKLISWDTINTYWTYICQL
jgi:hypothetical protein